MFASELLHLLDAMQLLLCLVYLISLTLKLAPYEDNIVSIAWVPSASTWPSMIVSFFFKCLFYRQFSDNFENRSVISDINYV